MRQVDFDAVQAKQEGDFDQLPAGTYVCAVTEMTDFPGKEYVQMLVDIIQGEHASHFAGKFYQNKPYRHRIVLSYKDTALGFLKGRLQALTASNPGFDAEAAWNGGNLQMFVGKVVYAVFRAEEYLDKKTGEFRLGEPAPYRIVRAEDMSDPKNADPLPRMLSDEEKANRLEQAGISLSSAPDVYDEDVPF